MVDLTVNETQLLYCYRNYIVYDFISKLRLKYITQNYLLNIKLVSLKKNVHFFNSKKTFIIYIISKRTAKNYF